jgi:hypothetical protein
VKISIGGAGLGPSFSGGGRFVWRPEPAASPPFEAVFVEQRASGLSFSVPLSPDVPFEVRREPRRLTLLVGTGREPAARAPGKTPLLASLSPVLLAAAAPRVVAVRAATVDSRTAVTVLSSAALGEVDVRRAGNEVTVSLDAEPAAGLVAPAAEPPIESIEIEGGPAGTALRITVAPEVPYEVLRQEKELTLVFGEVSVTARPPATEEPPLAVEELYKRLFPMSPVEAPSGGEETSATEAPRTDSGEGLVVSGVRVRPSVVFSYIDADTTALGLEPVRDQYLQLQPRVVADRDLGQGRLEMIYEPRIRRYSSLDELDGFSHFLDTKLETPLGTRVAARVGHHFSRGLLETTEVDPGREYFFELGRFTRHTLEASARTELGARFTAELGGSITDVSFAERSSFIEYQSRLVSAGLGFDVGTGLRGAVTYLHDEVPAPFDHPQARSSAHSLRFALSGELLPLLNGELAVAYRDQSNPDAGPGGRRFRGLTASGRFTKEIGRASSLTVLVSRSTQISAFEDDGFYVVTSGIADLAVPLPWSLSLRTGAGYHWNAYRTPASALGRPREDRLFGWSVGLGRPLGGRAFVRADYRKDRRDSNLEGFDTVTDAVVLQLGVGLFGTPVRR